LLMDYAGALGPNAPQSDTTLHPLCLSRCDAVELTEREWRVVRFGHCGAAGGRFAGSRIAKSVRLHDFRMAATVRVAFLQSSLVR
jgi:hypothetical protein